MQSLPLPAEKMGVHHMTEGWLVDNALEEHEGYLACGLVARHLYRVMINCCDSEGRARAAARTWKRNASLSDNAEVPLEEIEAAIEQLAHVGLIVLYGKGYMFLPGRFEHNVGRDYWKKSGHPLPSREILEAHPEYLEGIKRLSTKGRLAKGAPADPRYPELLGRVRDEPGQTVTNREGPVTNRDEPGKGGKGPSEVGVGVGVGIRKKEEEGGIDTTVDNSTSSETKIPPPVDNSKPEEESLEANPGQVRMLEEMAEERRTTLPKFAALTGLSYPIRAQDVTPLRRALGGIPRGRPADLAVVKRNDLLDRLWLSVEEALSDPDAVIAAIKDIQDETSRRAMMNRLETKLRELADKVGRSLETVLANVRGEILPSAPFLRLADLPAVYQELGIGEAAH